MRLALAAAFLVLAGSVSSADQLDGLAVRVEPTLTHFNYGGDGLTVGVEVSNTTPTNFDHVMFECVGFADGKPVAQGGGIVDKVGAYRSEYSEAGLYHFSTKPTSVSCRITKAIAPR